MWGLPGGTGAYQKLLRLCKDPQECWLFWLCSPLVPPPLQGTVLHEHSQSACGPVGKVLCSKKDRNKPEKCWISFSSAGKGSRDSRRSCSSDSRTWVPCEGKEVGEGSLAESTQPTQKCLQKQLRICLLDQWILLVLGSCLHSKEDLAPSTRTKDGPIFFVEVFNRCKRNKLSKHPFSQRSAGQNSLKCKKKWSLFCTQPVLAQQGSGAAAFQERGIKHRRWSWAEQQPRLPEGARGGLHHWFAV